MPTLAEQLRSLVEQEVPRLGALTESAVSLRPGPEAWSPKEILGHLIDSAANNHQRFVRAQAVPDFSAHLTYAQNDWVRVQAYQEADWTELVQLWAASNRHLARIFEAMPEAIRTLPRHPHPLAKASWNPVAEDQPATLEDLMKDYLGHARHHLKAIP